MTLYSAPLSLIVAALRSGSLDLHSYIDSMLARIEAAEAVIHSLMPETDRRTRLHADADGLLQRFPNPADRPPLFGALVGVKDIIHADGFVTRAGTAVPPELFAAPQADVVTQLKEAGALIVGKTVTTEFAYFEPGPTRNPHNPEHTPGGSSSGSAAAVAAGLCHLSLGTQTVGSVIRPAAFCGVVGFKPSFDRIATKGMIYFSRAVDHLGLFTQDIAGMQEAASVLLKDWRSELGNLRRPVLGIPIGAYLAQTERDGMLAFEEHIRRLQWGGYTVVRVPEFGDIKEIDTRHQNLIAAEFAHEHRELYADHANKYRPRSAALIEKGKGITTGQVEAGKASCMALRNRLHEQMAKHGIDIWVTPAATGPAPAGIHATGNPSMNMPWTHAGLPTLTLPAGKADNGLPLGVQFSAAFGKDEELLAWSFDLSRKL